MRRAFLLLAILARSPLWGQTAISEEDAVAAALALSTDLRITLLRSQAAARAFELGIRDFLPRLSIGANDTKSVVMNAPDTSSRSVSVTIEQPVFDGGRLATRRMLSRLELELENGKYAQQCEELSDMVRGLFRKVLVQRQKLGIQEEIRRVSERQLDIARTEREIGAIRDIDLVEAELELATVELDIRNTRTLLEEYEHQLRRAIGRPVKDPLELAGGIETAYPGMEIPEDSEYFFSLAAENNAALKKQDLQVRKTLEDLRNAEAWFVPTISLQVTLAVSGESYPLQSPSINGKLVIDFPSRPFPLSTSLTLGETPGKESTASAGASVSVLQEMGFYTDRAAGELANREARLRRDELSENLRFEISKALTTHARKVESAALARKGIELQERKAAIMERQLELGETKRIDFMQAQTRLARDRASLLEEVLLLIESERAFERLLGARAGQLQAICRAYEERSTR